MSFFLTHSVAARVSRLTYGTKCVTRYDSNDIEHIRRHDHMLTRPSGNQVIPDVYHALLTKVRTSCWVIIERAPIIVYFSRARG